MERRKAITTAAAASLTLLAGAAGIALNSGIVGAGADDTVGQVSPVDSTTNPPITVYAADQATGISITAAPKVKPSSSEPVTTSAASGYQDDDGGAFDEPDDHERESHEEYEGADDDD